MKRRHVIAHLGAALACSQRATLAAVLPPAPSKREMASHLDLREARIVKEAFLAAQASLPNDRHDATDLHLSQYSSADLDALKYLGQLNSGFTYLGFETISPGMAEVISQWNAYFLLFNRLRNLSRESAVYLGRADAGHALVFDLPIELDVPTARAIACNGSPLSLEFKVEPDLRIAQALATHQHEMFLTLPGELVSPSLARALSRHAGYLLQIQMDSRPTGPVLEAFSSNLGKKVTVNFQDGKSGARGGTVAIVDDGFYYGGF